MTTFEIISILVNLIFLIMFFVIFGRTGRTVAMLKKILQAQEGINNSGDQLIKAKNKFSEKIIFIKKTEWDKMQTNGEAENFVLVE